MTEVKISKGPESIMVDEKEEYVRKIERLEKQLEIATKALKEYADQDKWSYCSEDIDYFYSTKPGYRDAEKALKEIKEVK